MDKDIEERITQLGNVSISPKVAGMLSTRDIDMLLARHVLGDFGDVDMEEMKANDLAMYQRVGTVRSEFETERGTIYIITRFNQPVTVVAYDVEVMDDAEVYDGMVPNVSDDADSMV